ncbi:hypothetical protein Tco_0668878 [Tanacetum coccineum]
MRILRYNVSKPLPLGGDPGHVTIQSDFFFNKDLEYLRYGRKIGRPALSISRDIKAAYYPEVNIEQMVLTSVSKTTVSTFIDTHLKVIRRAVRTISIFLDCRPH